MINYDKTLATFGYTFSSLKDGSDKKIIINCDYCNKELVVKKSYLKISRSIVDKDSCNKCRPLKTKEVNLVKYGVTCNLHSELGKIKTKQTCLAKYNSETFFGSDSGKHSVKHSQSKIDKDKVKEQIRQTCLMKYGVDNPSKNTEIKRKIGLKNTKYVYNDKTINDYAEELGLAYSSFQQRVKKDGFEIAIKYTKCISSLELKLKQWFDDNNIKYNLHYYIDNYICDFYLPDFNLLIEVDGLYWHSDLIIKDKFYHFNKQQYYNSKGYSSLFFREDEINNKWNIVISIIKNKLKLNSKIWARKCTVAEIDSTKASQFLDTNHLMGSGLGNSLGLVYNNELVAILQTKLRKTGLYEVARFCTKNNASIVGGYSRLLSAFEQKYKPIELINFIDRRYGSGQYLTNFGFEQHKTYISFQWCKKNTTRHRMTFPANTGYDNGYAKIWDCGQTKYKKLYNIIDK